VETSHDALITTHDEVRWQWNWPLLVSLLACLLFWGAVAFGIVAVA